MSRIVAIAVVLTSVASFSPPPAGAAESSDRPAVAVAERSMRAMGGSEAFDSVRLLRFDFEVLRDGERVALYSHWWDRRTGDYRLEGTDQQGRPFRVLFDVDTGPVPEGEAWRGSMALTGDEETEMLERAYGQFVNDSYWLLMPWKWLDPGVELNSAGETRIDDEGGEGEVFDVVALEFESGVGLTSNDRYWAYVSKRTGLMERWEYLLQEEDGTPGTGDRTAWSWEGWERTEAGILLSTVKRRLGEGPEVTITFPVVVAEADVEAEELQRIFAPTSPVGSGTPTLR